MHKCMLTVVIFMLYLFPACDDTTNKNDSDDQIDLEVKGWELVWFDEFDYSGLPDKNKWGYDVGGHGWGNNELQYYTEDSLRNARVEDGKLIIEAHKENIAENDYSSARLISKGKGDWTYGRFEIRAKLPSGRGIWPAIWMLASDWTYGQSYWPDNGEIDIMEYVGYDPAVVHAAIHTKAYNHMEQTQKTAKIDISTAETEFHLYAMEWTSEKICVYADTTKYFTFENRDSGWKTWPFDRDFHLLLNIAVGGNWGGAQGIDDTIFPQNLEIDYVRVYKPVY